MLVQARDPIPQLKKYILEAGLMSEGQIKDIEKEVLDVVDEAVKFADESPKPVSLKSCHYNLAGVACRNSLHVPSQLVSVKPKAAPKFIIGATASPAHHLGFERCISHVAHSVPLRQSAKWEQAALVSDVRSDCCCYRRRDSCWRTCLPTPRDSALRLTAATAMSCPASLPAQPLSHRQPPLSPDAPDLVPWISAVWFWGITCVCRWMTASPQQSLIFSAWE